MEAITRKGDWRSLDFGDALFGIRFRCRARKIEKGTTGQTILAIGRAAYATPICCWNGSALRRKRWVLSRFWLRIRPCHSAFRRSASPGDQDQLGAILIVFTSSGVTVLFPASFCAVFQNHSIPTLPLPDASIDLITAFSVFTHMEGMETAWLMECHCVFSDRED